jgi:hypothetical protein
MPRQRVAWAPPQQPETGAVHRLHMRVLAPRLSMLQRAQDRAHTRAAAHACCALLRLCRSGTRAVHTSALVHSTYPFPPHKQHVA